MTIQEASDTVKQHIAFNFETTTRVRDDSCFVIDIRTEWKNRQYGITHSIPSRDVFKFMTPKIISYVVDYLNMAILTKIVHDNDNEFL